MVVLAGGGPAVGGTNTWTMTGPDGGPVRSVAFHPSEASTQLAGSSRGVHLSLTDGGFWALMFEGQFSDVTRLAYDPSRPARVFALGNGLYRSEDDARTFSVNIAPAANLVSMSIAGDGVLYVLEMTGRVFRSGDAGTSWTELLNHPWSNADWRSAVAVDPSNSNNVFVAMTLGGTFKSTNGGATWSGPLPDSAGIRSAFDMVAHVAIDPDDGDHVIVSTTDGLVSSTDGGAHWFTQLPGTYYVWAGFDPASPTGAVAMSGQGQIVRSVDRGLTWPAGLRPPRLPVYEAYELALSPTSGRMLAATSEGPMFSDDGGATFQKRVTNIVSGISVALSAANDGTIYTAMRFPWAAYTRSGASWHPVNNAALVDTSAAGRELKLMAVAPTNSSIVYVNDMDRRFMRSIDGGATWIGPHPQFSNTGYVVTGIAVDPTNPLVVYVGTSEKLWRSTDGGLTWNERSAGLPVTNGPVVISKSDPSVLYVLALTTPSTVEIYRSTDAGLSWSPTTALPSTDIIHGLTVDPTNAQTVYVTQTQAISKSTNGGTSWTPMDVGLPVANTYFGSAVLVDPVHPETLMVSMGRGLVRSVDGGSAWLRTPFDRGGLGLITLNPQRPGLVVGAVYGAGMVEYEFSPDLAVAITGLGDRIALGATATAQVVVRNNGPHASSGAHVTVTLPAAFTVPTAPAGCALVATRLECDVAALQVGGSRTIFVPIAVSSTETSGGMIAEVRGYEPDVVGADNQAFAGVIIETFSNLAVALGVLPAVTVGDTASLVATVTNAGPQAAPLARLEVELTGGAFGLLATPSQGTCVANGSVFTTFICDLGTLNAGASATVTVQMRGETVGAHTINAEVSSTNFDPDAADNTRTTTLTVNAAASPPPPPPPPSGGSSSGGGSSGGSSSGSGSGSKSGGGSFDWLVVLLLGSLALRRSVVRAPARR